MSYDAPDARAQIDPDAPTTVPAADRVLSWAHREMRHEFAGDVTLTEPQLDVPVSGTIRGLSAGGAYLETRRSLRIDTPVALCLPLEDGSLAVTGRVIWIRRAGGSKLPPGIGIRFDPLSGEGTQRLAAALELLPMARGRGASQEPELDYRFSEPRD